MTAIFTETQLDGADSGTIHELEELGCCARPAAAALVLIMKYLIQSPALPQANLNPHSQHASPENRLVPCRVSCHQLGTRIAQECCLPLQLGRLSWGLTASSEPLQGC